MATQQKTIKVPVNFCNFGTVADAVLTTIGTPTIYIPENSVTNPITITSAILFVYAQDMSTVTGGTINETRVAATLSGAAASTITDLDDLSNTAENWGGVFGGYNFTSYFNTNFGTVTSKTCQVGVYFDISTGTTLTTNAVQGYWEITYSYSDTELNRIQTIAIPMESITGGLTITANTAYCTIPQLTGGGGWLNGYASPVIRHIWAEVTSVSGTNAAATAQVLNWGFNGVGGGGSRDSRNNSLATDTYIFSQIDLSGLTVSATNTLDLWSSVATRFHCSVVTIYVSFEFVVSGTTRVLNYVEIPMQPEAYVNGTASASANRLISKMIIPESGTITQRAIGVEVRWESNASSTAQIKAGSQAAFRAYAPIGSLVATQFLTQHLFDSRSASGSGITLARGENTFQVDLYRSAGFMLNTCGIIRVLYESDVSSAGIDNHSQTVSSLIRQYDNLLTGDETTQTSFAIPSSNYWIHSAGLVYNYWVAVAQSSLLFQTEVKAGEAEGDGWRTTYCSGYLQDGEVSNHTIVTRDENFKRYPSDPDTNRLDIETTRGLRSATPATFRFSSKWSVSYHGISYTISGNITNSAGGTVNLYLFKVTNNELYAISSRVGNGAFSFTVYDDVSTYYVVAQESTTKKGVSYNGVPATDFDIDLEPVGGGSATVGGRILIT